MFVINKSTNQPDNFGTLADGYGPKVSGHVRDSRRMAHGHPVVDQRCPDTFGPLADGHGPSGGGPTVSGHLWAQHGQLWGSGGWLWALGGRLWFPETFGPDNFGPLHLHLQS